MTTCSVNSNETLHESSNGLMAIVIEKLTLGLSKHFRLMHLKAKIQQERQQLTEMTDRELRDLGISRGQVYEESMRSDIPQERRIGQ